MTDPRCPRCAGPIGNEAVGGVCRDCLRSQGRCVACGDPLDPFTRSAYISPTPDKTCLDCREAEREIPGVPQSSPWKKAG